MRSAPRRRGGFTLVELLVVVGIIAVLVGILLPALSRARSTANRVKCMSNIKQIGLAMVMYTQENKGIFPSAARAEKGELPQDFVFWEPVARHNANNVFSLGIPFATQQQYQNQSALVQYMGNRVFNPAVWICPADDVTTHPFVGSQTYKYPFSYTMNVYFDSGLLNAITAYGVQEANYMGGSVIKLVRVKHSSSTVMVMEETINTINDGVSVIDTVNSITGTDPTTANVTVGPDYLSVQHDQNAKKPDSVASLYSSPLLVGRDKTDNMYNSQGRGLVCFADGHADYVTREYVQLPSLHHWDPRY